MRQTLCVCILFAACGGTPVTPTPTSGGALPSPVPAPAPSPVPAPNPGTTTSDVRPEDDLGGRLLFPSDNWWNEDVSSAPVDAQSSSFIDFIGRTRGMHPDFGPPPYGIPY